MTAQELAKKLSERKFRTPEGFYSNGVYYNGSAVKGETTIEFTYTKLSYVGADVFNKTLVNTNNVAGVESIKVYNEREGYKTPYANVILKV